MIVAITYIKTETYKIHDELAQGHADESGKHVPKYYVARLR
jgi:hypothetical protein